jgi:hypothetical protein
MENVGSGRYFMTILNISWPIDIIYGRLVYVVCGHLVHFSQFGPRKNLATLVSGRFFRICFFFLCLKKSFQLLRKKFLQIFTKNSVFLVATDNDRGSFE